MTPDGRFGGPTRVALDVAAEQIRRGLPSAVYAGADDYTTLPSEFSGVPLHLARTRSLVPGLGYAATVAPGLRRLVFAGLTGDELFHVHLARDLVTLPVALELRRRSIPYIIQTHGMIDAPSHPLAPAIDALLTRQAVRGAARALVLTDDEADEIARLSAGTTQAVRFGNGVEIRGDDIPPVERSKVLFLGRLHPRKGATVFAEAAAVLAVEFPDVGFEIAGPDEGDRRNVSRVLADHDPGRRVKLSGPMPPADVATAMRAARVFVQPAPEEPFGMTIVEALAAGTPVALHSTSALAATVTKAGAGWQFNDAAELRRLLRRLLLDPDQLASAGEQARTLAQRDFSIRAIVDDLLIHYDVLDRHGPPGSEG